MRATWVLKIDHPDYTAEIQTENLNEIGRMVNSLHEEALDDGFVFDEETGSWFKQRVPNDVITITLTPAFFTERSNPA